jgi:hypothetical protein
LKLFELRIELSISFIFLNAQLDCGAAKQARNQEAAGQDDRMKIRKVDGDADNQQDGAVRIGRALLVALSRCFRSHRHLVLKSLALRSAAVREGENGKWL